ncbi:MAG: pyridoxal phosphate-dependent aminotransferase family protein [Planctomycetes bacterium]|nr:pyridoxal phosphate-dependent aminotransferase family protein [Planctomycetota bacterium]
MSVLPMHNLAQAIRQHGLVRFIEHYAREFPDTHLKDLVVDRLGPNREMDVNGRQVVNFGSDSFLGLDQDPRVQAALVGGVSRWGSHNGASRAFSSVRSNVEAEEKLASWLGTEAVLIYPSVSLANLGALPGLVSKRDLLVLDEHAHNSMQEGAKIAQANGVRAAMFADGDPADLERILDEAGEYRVAVVAVDGVYSMTGALPRLAELNEVCLRRNAVLYVDDAHATGVLGPHGRGTVLDALGSYDNTLVVGSLSKGFSCFGGFVGCSEEFKRLLKIRSTTFIFGGPVPPPYLDAICVVCDILNSDEYAVIHARLQSNLRDLAHGAEQLGYVVLGGQTPILSLLTGDEEITLQAGRFLFEKGFYVQSVTFPAVPYHAGVLRIQANANHQPEAIDGLLGALAELQRRFALPTTRQPGLRIAA